MDYRFIFVLSMYSLRYVSGGDGIQNEGIGKNYNNNRHKRKQHQRKTQIKNNYNIYITRNIIDGGGGGGGGG